MEQRHEVEVKCFPGRKCRCNTSKDGPRELFEIREPKAPGYQVIPKVLLKSVASPFVHEKECYLLHVPHLQGRQQRGQEAFPQREGKHEMYLMFPIKFYPLHENFVTSVGYTLFLGCFVKTFLPCFPSAPFF